MKQKFSKILSLMLAVILLCSAFSGMSVSAASDISSVEIAFTTPKVGSLLDTSTNIGLVAAIEHCTASVTWNDAVANPISDGHTFEADSEYRVDIKLSADTGYKFTDNASVSLTVNGVATTFNILDRNASDYGFILIDFAVNLTADGYIATVDLTNVPSPTVSAAATDYTYTHIESGTEIYTATGKWYVFNHDTAKYDPMASTDTFVADKSYQLDITVIPALGYAFDRDSYTFTVNGEYANNSYIYSNKGYIYLYFNGGTPIENVTINTDALPKAQIGKNFDNTEDIVLTLPAGTNYIAKGYWCDDQGNTTGTFKNGKSYRFYYTVAPKAGYCFSESTYFILGGEDQGQPQSNGEQQYYHSYRVSYKTVIDTVELSDAPTAEVGKTIKASPDIKVPNGAKYSVDYAFWYDSETGTSIDTDTTAQKDKLYDISLRIIPDAGYEFAEYVTLKINGASHRAQTNFDDMYYSRSYDFRKTIDRIEVTGITKPTVGATPTTDGLKEADADKYEIISAEWIDILPDGEAPATKFEDGHMYILNVNVAAKGDYWIAPYHTVLFNGEEDFRYYHETTKNVTLYAQFDLRKPIDEVRIENVPEFKVGASTTTDGVVTDLKIPNGANYSIGYARWLVLENGSYEDFSGVFQKGKYYCLSIQIEAKNGYKVDSEQTVFYTNGTKIPTNRIAPHLMGADLNMFFGEDIKLIDRVELTVEKPVIGDHYSMPPVITAKNNTGYSVSEESFWIIGNGDDFSQFEGYFSSDKKNGVHIRLMAKDGYIFSEDLKIIINGKALSAEDFDHGFASTLIPYFYNEKCAHIYTDANDETCDACGEKRQVKSPQTRDSSTALFATIIASGALLIISWKRKVNS